MEKREHPRWEFSLSFGTPPRGIPVFISSPVLLVEALFRSLSGESFLKLSPPSFSA